MSIDQSIVGKATEPQAYEVEKGAIRKFAEAIGDTNPLYLDEARARACGFASVIAPPTFPTTFRAPLPFAVEMSHVLHGEQDFTYTRPIVAGDTIRCTSKVTKIYEREGSLGQMTFVYIETSGEDLSGQPVFMAKSTIIVH